MPTVGHEPPGSSRPCAAKLAVDVDEDGAGPHGGETFTTAARRADGHGVHVGESMTRPGQDEYAA